MANGGFQARRLYTHLLVNLWKEIYDIVVDGRVDGLVGGSLGGSTDWLWTCPWPMQSVRIRVPANLELWTCAGANGDRAAARSAGHHWSQDRRATLEPGHSGQEGNTQHIMHIMLLQRCTAHPNRRQHQTQRERGQHS